jgi:hypothetical protein
MIEEAESGSETTCEDCGKLGEIIEVERGWLRASCITHVGETPNHSTQTDHKRY